MQHGSLQRWRGWSGGGVCVFDGGTRGVAMQHRRREGVEGWRCVCLRACGCCVCVSVCAKRGVAGLSPSPRQHIIIISSIIIIIIITMHT